MRMVQIVKGPAPLPAKKAGMKMETTHYLKTGPPAPQKKEREKIKQEKMYLHSRACDH